MQPDRSGDWQNQRDRRYEQRLYLPPPHPTQGQSSQHSRNDESEQAAWQQQSALQTQQLQSAPYAPQQAYRTHQAVSSANPVHRTLFRSSTMPSFMNMEDIGTASSSTSSTPSNMGAMYPSSYSDGGRQEQSQPQQQSQLSQQQHVVYGNTSGNRAGISDATPVLPLVANQSTFLAGTIPYMLPTNVSSSYTLPFHSSQVNADLHQPMYASSTSAPSSSRFPDNVPASSSAVLDEGGGGEMFARSAQQYSTHYGVGNPQMIATSMYDADVTEGTAQYSSSGIPAAQNIRATSAFAPYNAHAGPSSSLVFPRNQSSVPMGATPRNVVHKRVPAACNFCRARKLRCDGMAPCRQCARRNLDCEYSPSAETRRSRRATTSVVGGSSPTDTHAPMSSSYGHQRRLVREQGEDYGGDIASFAQLPSPAMPQKHPSRVISQQQQGVTTATQPPAFFAGFEEASVLAGGTGGGRFAAPTGLASSTDAIPSRTESDVWPSQQPQPLLQPQHPQYQQPQSSSSASDMIDMGSADYQSNISKTRDRGGFE